jgi:hypothetical protein
MLDLQNNQYDLNILKTNIYAVSLLDILKTQKLTAEFCVKYILNSEFQILEQDQNITMDVVIELQPHILKRDLIIAHMNLIDKQIRFGQSRIDSFEDFEKIANRT